MTLYEINNIPPLEGAFNIHPFIGCRRVVGDRADGLLLTLVPKRNIPVEQSIEHEYDNIGFSRRGGTCGRRSVMEQTRFAQHAAALGLRVLPPLCVEEGAPYYPFLPKAMTWDQYLPGAEEREMHESVLQLFDDLRKAHAQGIVYGDRWSRNILVDPKFGVLHIDFDLKLGGPVAKEFEVAQAAYYTLCGARERVIPLLAQVLSADKNWLCLSHVEEFMRGHAQHFLKNPNYGGIVRETETLLEMVRNLQRSIPQIRRK